MLPFADITSSIIYKLGLIRLWMDFRFNVIDFDNHLKKF